MLGHHYQRDEVIQFADVTGDSFKLARDAAGRPGRRVHRLLRRALHGRVGRHPDRRRRQQVILPDLAAGCSMADMARLRQVEDAWDALADAGIQDSVVPVTYMNSSADIKAFCGRNGGVVCTSSNADVALEWAFDQKADSSEAPRSSSSPTSTSAATPRCSRWASPSTSAWSGTRSSPAAASPPRSSSSARMILWKGHCSVHGRFSEDVVDELRAKHPGINILVHPECTHEVVLKADLVGSTEFIIKTIEAAEPGTVWAIGTELNLVQRLADAHPDKTIVFLDRNVCYCSTMNRIDLPHLVWALENLVAGTVVNQITVDPETEADALVALQRMLDLPGKSHRD